MSSETRTALVIGAGIVGLCTAYVLQRSGVSVTVMDPNAPGSQCSSGNAGALSSGSVVPLAMPGLLKDTASMLLDPAGPLHIPARYWLRGAPWLARFAHSARRGTVERIADALKPLLKGAVGRHARLADEIGRPDLVRRDGQLHVYPDVAAMGKDATGWAMKAARGLRVERVDAAAIRELEPAVAPGYTAGVFLPDEGRVTDPQAYCEAIAAAARQAGTRFVQGRVTSLLRTRTGWRATDGANDLEADHAVISAGAWSARVLAGLGLRVPLQTQRGYHLQLGGAQDALSRIVVLADRKVFLNPMARGLRIAGTVEIDALDRPANTRRAMLLQQHAGAGLRGIALEGGAVWMGHRPCLPDSMPVLGSVPDAPGLWCAFGHGHLGVTESINTADWLADEINGRGDAVARQAHLKAFSITRFRGWRV
ncbi:MULTISPECIES: FAD-binding oxidoreductase [unclassified Achromobacter]|uniref:NAD(P)/FAD-dependent oxidoreductase n=1 Tax=unclassified Achromobacter TaxID=2626865 RepID=UPI000B5158E2|nr:MULTISPECIES: FAD-dependent oxidoreductase [unclassified Achromobacter]OWT68917.1 FAD-dependent oxidoreductase [Achromobacter sp. HZ28]OWT78520.1 FAD-dependent oxidoreductase [Achromobacter sp. HZ34]